MPFAGEGAIVVLGIGVGICLGVMFFMLTQMQQMQLQGGNQPYRYELERDEKGRVSGMIYIPLGPQIQQNQSMLTE